MIKGIIIATDILNKLIFYLILSVDIKIINGALYEGKIKKTGY
jgi:hypothetical protein